MSVVESWDRQRTGEDEGQECNVETSHRDCLFVCSVLLFFTVYVRLVAYVFLDAKMLGESKSSLPGLF